MRVTLSATKSHGKFGDTLRGILAQNRVAGAKPDSIRGLARVMGAGDDARAAVAKRNIHRWVGGIRPNMDNRVALAAALGVDASVFADDDEEADPVADLLAALRLVVREEMSRVVA